MARRPRAVDLQGHRGDLLRRTGLASAVSDAGGSVGEGEAEGLGDEVQREKRKVLEHYRIATLDWKAAAYRRPTLWRPGPIPGTEDTDVNHPSWETHQMIAEAIASLWARAAWRDCRRGSS